MKDSLMLKGICTVVLYSLFVSCKQTVIQYPLTKVTIEEPNVISNGIVGSLLGLSLLIAVGFIFLVYVIAQVVYKLENNSWKRFWDWLEGHLTQMFGLTWLFGFCVYAVGMFVGIEEAADSIDRLWRLLGVAPMAVIHAFGMFIMDSDVSAVHDVFHDNLLYMVLFSLAHFFAACVSLIFVIKHFGYNIVAGIHLWLTSHSFRRHDHLFIFWGMNDASYSLAKDLKMQKNVSGSWKALIVKTSDNREKESDRTGLDRLFNILSLKNIELDQFKELGFLTCNAFSRISNLEMKIDSENENGTQILSKRLRLKSLARLIRLTDNTIHVFMLSEDEKDNIKAASNLRLDQTITEFVQDNGHHVYIYCKARYASVNRVIEDMHSNNGMDIRIVDPANDSINILKAKREYHPINFVNIDMTNNLGTVTSAFNALVVGFGWTGRDAVRFLYEYGAFVKNSSAVDDDIALRENGKYKQEGSNRKVERSPFFCHVVDTEADKIMGIFRAHSPAMFNEANKSMLDIQSIDANSNKFIELLREWAKDLNYVVVATGNDDQNITIAVRIFKCVSMYRENLDNFCIFVHCHTREEERHMQRIADFYNEVNAPGENHHKPYIVVFGKTDQIYSYKQIVENQYEKEGEKYNAEYCEVSGNKGEKDLWKSRHNCLLNMRALNAYARLRRQECQDTSNAYHAMTKIHIMEEVVRERGLAYLQGCLLNKNPAPSFCRTDSDKNKPVQGQILSEEHKLSKEEELLLRNIAKLEHIRWIASHEVLGYNSYKDAPDSILKTLKNKVNECNEAYRLHNCMIPWQELDQESENAINKDYDYYPDYKLFDYAVVTTTIRLHAKRKESQGTISNDD